MLGLLFVFGSFWWYTHSESYYATQAKQAVQNFEPATHTLEEKDWNLPTELPEYMPEDVEITYSYGGGMFLDDIGMVISLNESHLTRTTEEKETTWNLYFDRTDIEKMYHVFRTRSFDTIRTKPYEDLVDDAPNMQHTISYTENEERKYFTVHSGPNSDVFDEDSDRWLDFIHLFTRISEIYP